MPNPIPFRRCIRNLVPAQQTVSFGFPLCQCSRMCQSVTWEVTLLLNSQVLRFCRCALAIRPWEYEAESCAARESLRSQHVSVYCNSVSEFQFGTSCWPPSTRGD